MRFGPFLVPAAIVAAVGVIIAAQSGWLDGSDTVPLVRADLAPHAAKVSARSTSVARQAKPIARPGAAPNDEATASGRSVGLSVSEQNPGHAQNAHGSGGAGLDADGIAPSSRTTTAPSPAAPDRTGIAHPDVIRADNTHAGVVAAPDALQSARDEAAKAKQDLLDVTKASVEAQRASEAEFERQKNELNEQIAQMRSQMEGGNGKAEEVEARAKALSGELAAAQQALAKTKQQLAASVPDAVSQADARAATAAAELADSRSRENALRVKLAALQGRPGKDQALEHQADAAAAKQLAEAKQRSDAAEAQAKLLGEKLATLQGTAADAQSAADRAANAETALTQARDHEKRLAGDVDALQAKVREGAEAQAKAATLKQALAQSRSQAATLTEQVGDLKADLAANAQAAATSAAKLKAANTLETDLKVAREQKDDALRQVATMKAEADDTAKLKAAEAAAARKITALQRQLDDSRTREADTDARLAALQAGTTASDSGLKTSNADVETLKQQLAAAASREKDLGALLAAAKAGGGTRNGDGDDARAADAALLAQLKDDLAGARRGEDTLRRESDILQREVTQAKAESKLLGEKLAALQVGMGMPVPSPRFNRRSPGIAPRSELDHESRLQQLDALKAEQLHQQQQALHVEADMAAKRHASAIDRAPVVQGARLFSVTPLPSVDRRATRKRDKRIARERLVELPPFDTQRSAHRTGAVTSQAEGISSLSPLGGLGLLAAPRFPPSQSAGLTSRRQNGSAAKRSAVQRDAARSEPFGLGSEGGATAFNF